MRTKTSWAKPSDRDPMVEFRRQKPGAISRRDSQVAIDAFCALERYLPPHAEIHVALSLLDFDGSQTRLKCWIRRRSKIAYLDKNSWRSNSLIRGVGSGSWLDFAPTESDLHPSPSPQPSQTKND
jgi:hypothetical protein